MPRRKSVATVVQEPFPILKLPPEIRHGIWYFTVVTDRPIAVKYHERQALAAQIRPSTLRSGKRMEAHHNDDVKRMNSFLAVAFTCRQIYQEVAPIYYSKNNFFFKHPCEYARRYDWTSDFVGSIGEHNARSITSMTIDLDMSTFELGLFQGLKYLDVVSDRPCRLNKLHKSCVYRFVKQHPGLVVLLGGKPWMSHQSIKEGNIPDSRWSVVFHETP